MTDPTLQLQILALSLFFLWRLYWEITERQANAALPKKREKRPLFHKRSLSKLVSFCVFVPVVLQLFNFSLLPFPERYLWLQYAGLGLVVTGFLVSIRGRQDLGVNWARSYDFQVKDKQQLVTSGIYKYIRHPIYSGLLLMFIGSELIVQSYLILLYLFIVFAAYIQAGWEERLLVKHFGNEYSSYMKRTKRFIPFIF